MSDLNEILCKLPVLKTRKIYISLIMIDKFSHPHKPRPNYLPVYKIFQLIPRCILSSEATNYSATQK